MAVRRELIPLGLVLVLLGGIGAMALQERKLRTARADARVHVLLDAGGSATYDRRGAQPATRITSPSVTSPGTPAERIDASDLGALPLRVAALPAPTRDVAAIKLALTARGHGTYIGDMLADEDSTLYRWPDRTVAALRVWVQPAATVPNWDDRYPRLVREVFPEWSAAGFPLRFLHVIDSASADLHVLFVAALPDRRIGQTDRYRDQNGWIVAATISIATQSPEGTDLRTELIRGIARHEVGHALGLGHATDPATVMFPESRTTKIALADRATLHLLYTLPPGPLR